MSLFGTPEERTRRLGRWGRPLFVAALLTVFFVATPLFSPASGVTLREKLAQKQTELNAAYAEYRQFQDELDALAEKQNAAEVRLAKIDNAIRKVENEISRASKDLAVIQAQLAERIVEIYKDGNSPTSVYLEILLGEGDFRSVLERLSLVKKIADQDDELFEQVVAYLERNQASEDALLEKRQAHTEVMAEIEALQAEMSEKFSASTDEYKRLTGQVLALREEVRKAEEAARRAAEEAARRAAAAKQRAAQQAAQQSAAKSRAASANYSGGVVASGSFVFPVAGPHSYIDSWGADRSGGRSHKGTDILAARGTPVVACVTGVVSRTTPTDTGLGGITIWLRGNNGYSYYYAHLDGIAGGVRAGTSVSAGEVIGWVGSTGNAGSCNHLHFGMYSSSGALNPYATLRASQ